jgi:hypothetical protein
MAGYQLDELAPYGRTRNPIAGLDVTELGVERRGAYRAPGVNRSAIPGMEVYEGERPGQAPRVSGNPNVGAAGSAEAQAFRNSGAVRAPPLTAASTSALTAAGEEAAANAPRLGAIRTAGVNAAKLGAGALPAIAGGLAFGAAGRALADNTQGAPVAGSQPGEIPRGPDGGAYPYQTPAAVPGNFFRDSEAGRNIGNIANAVGAGRIAATAAGGSGALVSRAPSLVSPFARAADAAVQGIAAGNVLPSAPELGAFQTSSGATRSADPSIGPQLGAVRAGSGRGTINPAAVDPNAPPPQVEQPVSPYALRAQQPNQPGVPPVGERAVDIEQRALAIDRQNSALRTGLDANGPGTHNPDGTGGSASLSSGYADKLERKNAETTAASLRFDAKLANGQRQRELLDEAKITEAAPRQEQLARAGLDNQVQLGAIRERGDLAQRQIADATARRGQDLEATGARTRNEGALAVERERGASARNIAELTSDARVAAAEARAAQPKYTAINLPDRLAPDGLTVLKSGQVLVGADGKTITPGGDDKAAAGPQVTPRAEYDKMSKGAKYVGPDGKTYIKG